MSRCRSVKQMPGRCLRARSKIARGQPKFRFRDRRVSASRLCRRFSRWKELPSLAVSPGKGRARLTKLLAACLPLPRGVWEGAREISCPNQPVSRNYCDLMLIVASRMGFGGGRSIGHGQVAPISIIGYGQVRPIQTLRTGVSGAGADRRK